MLIYFYPQQPHELWRHTENTVNICVPTYLKDSSLIECSFLSSSFFISQNSNSLKMIFLMCVNIAFNRLFKLSFKTLLTMNIIVVFTMRSEREGAFDLSIFIATIRRHFFSYSLTRACLFCDLFEKFSLIFLLFSLPYRTLSARRSLFELIFVNY